VAVTVGATDLPDFFVVASRPDPMLPSSGCVRSGEPEQRVAAECIGSLRVLGSNIGRTRQHNGPDTAITSACSRPLGGDSLSANEVQ
jgi:hypothetical protein